MSGISFAECILHVQLGLQDTQLLMHGGSSQSLTWICNYPIADLKLVLYSTSAPEHHVLKESL